MQKKGARRGKRCCEEMSLRWSGEADAENREVQAEWAEKNSACLSASD